MIAKSKIFLEACSGLHSRTREMFHSSIATRLRLIPLCNPSTTHRADREPGQSVSTLVADIVAVNRREFQSYTISIWHHDGLDWSCSWVAASSCCCSIWCCCWWWWWRWWVGSITSRIVCRRRLLLSTTDSQTQANSIVFILYVLCITLL